MTNGSRRRGERVDKDTMRKLRIVGILAGALCALALTAVPAMAHNFVASKVGKTTGKGFEEIPVEKGVTPAFVPAQMQEWKFGSFRILCYRAQESGEVTELVSETFTTNIKFLKCGWYPESSNSLHVAAAFSSSGLTVIYHANGYTEAVGNGEGEFIEYKKATILETAAYFKISSTKLCRIIIPEQTIPIAAIKKPNEPYSDAVYSNTIGEVPVSKTFPTGEQERLLITNAFKGVLYKYGAEGEETQCHNAPEFEKTAEEGGGAVAGQYKGILEEKIPGGNLKFE
jgi:hypothetical protein